MGALMFIGYLVAGVVIAQVIGMLWYSKFAFGSIWMRAIGKDEMLIQMEKEKGMGKTIVMSVIAWTVITFIILMYALENPGMYVREIFAYTAVMVIAFAGVLTIPSYMYESRSLTSWAIYFGYTFVVIVLQLVLYTQILF